MRRSAPAAKKLPTTGTTAGRFETNANWALTCAVSSMTALTAASRKAG
jgi:hypothetical protein